jgi:hypothetical protein
MPCRVVLCCVVLCCVAFCIVLCVALLCLIISSICDVNILLISKCIFRDKRKRRQRYFSMKDLHLALAFCHAWQFLSHIKHFNFLDFRICSTLELTLNSCLLNHVLDSLTPACFMRYSTVQYSTVQYSTVQYSTVPLQYISVQYTFIIQYINVPIQSTCIWHATSRSSILEDHRLLV